MPEKHLSIEEAINFQIWLDTNATRVDGMEGGWAVGETKEPIIFAGQIDRWRKLTGEADVVYPTGLEEKLNESGVIFDPETDKIAKTERDELMRQVAVDHIERNGGW